MAKGNVGRARAPTRLVLVALAWLGCERPILPSSPAPAPTVAHDPSGGRLSRALCEANCDRALRCAPAQERAPLVAACGCQGVSDAELLRPDWTTAAIACLGRAECDEEAGSACELEAYRAIGAAPLAWPPAVMRCFQRAATCGGTTVSCRRIAAMSDPARAEVAACFDKPCEAYAACFRAFFDARVVPAVPGWR